MKLEKYVTLHGVNLSYKTPFCLKNYSENTEFNMDGWMDGWMDGLTS
jgi:hypothetical protein